jgi:predicted transcriptional regulator
MTGILVTKFKMGQIDVKDLAEMAADASRAERCSATKKVLVCVRDDADYGHLRRNFGNRKERNEDQDNQRWSLSDYRWIASIRTGNRD